MLTMTFDQSETLCAGALSKSQEIELFSAIVRNCPDGYVRDILSGIRETVQDAIRNDYCFIDYDLKRDIAALQEQRKELETDVRKLQERGENIRSQLSRAERTIRESETLSRRLRETVQAIRDM